MKKLTHLILLLVLGIFFFNSCRKEYSSESGKPITPPQVKPDLTSKITASVNGFITDENNNAVSGAVITAGTKTATTGKFGYFKISDAQLGKTAAFIKVEKAGYFAGYRTFLANEGKETFIRLKMIPKKIIGTVNAIAGGTAATTDGASVTLPANGVMVAAGSASYTGTVHVAAHWINPTNGSELQLTMPGDLEGIDTAGYLKVLETFGMMAVELSGDAGELLQVATGSQASLSFPIPSPLSAAAPASIPLWYFDESNGLWKEEGVATKTGSNYIGNVKHFSYWNCDYPLPSPVNFTCQIVDESLHPLANTEVMVWNNGQFSGSHGCTDTAGFIYGRVPSNSNLILDIRTPCYASAYSKGFTTLSSDVDLGTITANSALHSTDITGAVVDCNQQPVTEGYVVISNASTYSFRNVAHIKNGMFSLNTLTCGNPNNASVVAFDINANQESAPLSVSLVAGTNNLGTISACGVVSDFSSITYTIDGVVITRSEPLDSATIAYYNSTESRTSINSGGVYLQFDGGTSIGSGHSMLQFNISGNKHTPVNPIAVTITEYGVVGGFVRGSFSGTVKDQNLQTHSLSCAFKARRVQ